MIEHVRGRLVAKRPGFCVVECGGALGLGLSISSWTLAQLPALGEEVRLACHLVLRDEQAQLYGFASVDERELFLLLQGVQGVGPRLALAVLSAGPPAELRAAIASGARERFLAVPGVGRRTADRIIVELRERVTSADPEPEARSPAVDGVEGSLALARAGLLELGFDGIELDRMLSSALRECGADAPPEQLLSVALRTVRAAA